MVGNDDRANKKGQRFEAVRLGTVGTGPPIGLARPPLAPSDAFFAWPSSCFAPITPQSLTGGGGGRRSPRTSSPSARPTATIWRQLSRPAWALQRLQLRSLRSAPLSAKPASANRPRPERRPSSPWTALRRQASAPPTPAQHIRSRRWRRACRRGRLASRRRRGQRACRPPRPSRTRVAAILRRRRRGPRPALGPARIRGLPARDC